MLISGDFNAPVGSDNLRLQHLQVAHKQAGNGYNLTFPRQFPIWGIDHIMGNEFIEFIEFLGYESFGASYSDHYAQVAKLRVVELTD